jgi:two-component system KDP operon response regulator KdpE
VFRAGGLEVDVQRRLCWRSGTRVHLSPKEFDLLVFFMKNPGVTLPHIKLLRAVWGPDSPRGAVYLRSYIKALRKKIESNPSQPEYILTAPWVGYLFHDPTHSGGGTDAE